MNLNLQKIFLNSDSNLPWYTIASEMNIEEKYIRQASSMDCFAIVNLNVKPEREYKQAIFENKILEIDIGDQIVYLYKNNDEETLSIVNMICQGICQGIKKACWDLSKKEYLIRGITVTAIAVKYHPIDSRSHCYEIATYLALLKVFERVSLIKI